MITIINIVNIEDEPVVTHSYTKEAFLDRCNDVLHANYTLDELPIAEQAFLKKYKYLEIHESKLITRYEKRYKY